MKPWIVDTGASDHMTGDAAILQNYKPSNGHSSVHIADGSKSKIVGTGSIKLTKELYLDSVLHVPNLDCNLLSISKLARDLQCVTKFYPNSCVFQDLKSGKMIGSAELCSGLYLLPCGRFSNQVSQASCVQSQRESMNEHQVWESLLEAVPFLTRVTKSFPIRAELSTPMPSSVSIPALMILLAIALRKGVRRCTDHPIGNYVMYEGLSPSYRAFATSLDDTRVYNTIQEAFKISEWKKAVQDEIDALEKNGTWTITFAVGKRPVGCKLLLCCKTEHYRFFSHWLSIKIGSLHGNTTEGSMAKNQVCKLQKSLYGLKQSPRAWFDRFTKAVLKLGYKQGQADHTLFVKKSHAGKMAILIVYVDDIILSGNDMEELQNLKKYFSRV
ncbi:hypothetical protein AAG906_041016 [Vitis piasezkii]